MNNFILVGEMGSGKDTLAVMIPNVIRVAFGDELRTVAKLLRTYGVSMTATYLETLGVPYCKKTEDALREFGKIPCDNIKDRELLQKLGTWCRQYRDDIWIHAMKLRMKLENSYVITDCRRISEFKVFPNSVSIYIDCPLEVRKQRILDRDGKWDDKWLDSPAEAEIKELKKYCMLNISNDCSLENLQYKINTILFYLDEVNIGVPKSKITDIY